MDLETFVIAVFCLVDDLVRDLRRDGRLRRRGPASVLADSEVLAIEAAGEFLGLDTERALHAHFRRHFGHLFPGLRAVHRTTLARQAANLWAVKEAVCQRLAAATPCDRALAVIYSLPVPVCRFARAHRRALRRTDHADHPTLGGTDRAHNPMRHDDNPARDEPAAAEGAQASAAEGEPAAAAKAQAPAPARLGDAMQPHHKGGREGGDGAAGPAEEDGGVAQVAASLRAA